MTTQGREGEIAFLRLSSGLFALNALYSGDKHWLEGNLGVADSRIE